MHIIRANLSERHTSGKFGTVIMYANNYEKKRTIVWYGRSVMENDQLILLMFHNIIWLV